MTSNFQFRPPTSNAPGEGCASPFRAGLGSPRVLGPRAPAPWRFAPRARVGNPRAAAPAPRLVILLAGLLTLLPAVLLAGRQALLPAVLLAVLLPASTFVVPLVLVHVRVAQYAALREALCRPCTPSGGGPGPANYPAARTHAPPSSSLWLLGAPAPRVSQGVVQGKMQSPLY